MTSNGHEKSPLQSKKFVAFLVSTLTMKLLFGVVIAWAWNLDELGMRPFILLMTLVIVDGFVTVGFILGQAGLDKFVRLAHIAAEAAKHGGGPGAVSQIVAKGTKGLIKRPGSEEDPAPA